MITMRLLAVTGLVLMMGLHEKARSSSDRPWSAVCWRALARLTISKNEIKIIVYLTLSYFL